MPVIPARDARAAFSSFAVLAVMTAPAMAEETVLLHAAGSLRGALTEVAKGFEAAGGGKVQAKYGPSGLLKDEIAAGAKAEVFASANMEHPQALAAAKPAGRRCCSRATGFARWCGPVSRSSRPRCWVACSMRKRSSAPRRRRLILGRLRMGGTSPGRQDRYRRLCRAR